ncbi:MAG: acyltransferase, partial [Nitrospirota bacterium]
GSKIYADCKIFGHANVKIGKDVLIGGETVIITSGHNYNDIGKPIKKQGLCRLPVTIEDGAWLGFRVTVLPGAVIGQRSVIGAGAVVSNNISPNTIAVGVPARVIRKLA